MSTATSRARQGCRWAHRHWPRLVKGLPGGQKTHLSKAAVRLGRQGVVELTNTNADEAKGVVKPLLGQQLWKWTLAAGVLTIVLGGIVLAWPGPTLLVASTLFGVYLLLTGFVGLFMAFTLPRSAGMRVLLFISGILSVVLAILSFRHFGDAYAILLLSLWIGIGFIFQGVSAIAAAIGESEPARARLVGRPWRHLGDRRPRCPCLALRLDRRTCGGCRRLARHPRRRTNHPFVPDPQGRQDVTRCH